MKTRLAALIIAAILIGFGIGATGIAAAQTGPPPGCTNGDCAPPDCSNGDCAPPGCTNGDCEPPEPGKCCCVGENQPGDVRVCCCRSADLASMTCRESLVLDTGYPDNWHQTLAQETLDGQRPRACTGLLAKYCDRPVAEVCAGQKVKACPKVVAALCRALDRVCLYRFCGPGWFPYDEPTPDRVGCEWWDQIRACKLK